MPVELGSAHGSIVIDASGATKAADQVSKSMQNMGHQAHQMGSRLGKLSMDLRMSGMTIAMGIGAPLTAVGVAVTKMSMDFEESMQHVVGLVGVSQRQVDEWSQQLLTLGPKLGRGPKELADALYFITSSGLKGSEAISVLTASAKAASSGLGETKVVADAVTSALSAYGQENLSAGKAVGILIAAVREGKAEASEIAPALGRVIPIAAQLGISFDQVGATMASMTRVGFDAAEAATNLSGIMAAVLKPSKQAADELAKFGLSGEQLRQMIKERGLLAVLTLLKDTIGQDDEALAKIFPNIRGFRGLLSLVGENAETASKIFKELAGATEEDLNRAFESASGTAKFKFNQAMAEVQQALIRLGDVIVPAVTALVTEFAGALRNVAEWFSKLPGPVQQAILAVGGFLIVLGPLMSILGSLLTLFGVLQGMVVTLAGGFFKAISAVGSFTKTGVEIIGYLKEAGFFTGALVAKLGLLGAGLVVVAKFIEAAGVASHATNEELIAMSKSGDLFKQAGASFEIIANGSNRLKDVFVQHQDEMKAKLLAGQVTLSEYNAEIERSARMAGVWRDEFKVGVGTVTLVDDAVQQLTEAQIEQIRVSRMETTEAQRAAHWQGRMGQAVEDAGDAMDDSTQQALDYAKAQEEMAAETAAAEAKLEALRTMMDGPVGEALADYNEKQTENRDKMRELQAELAKLEASHGRVAETRKKDKMSIEDMEQASAKLAYWDLKLADLRDRMAGQEDPLKAAKLNAEYADLVGKTDALRSKIDLNTGATKTFIDNSKRIGEIKGELDGLNDAYAANAEEHRKRTAQILFDMAQERLAANGLTDVEFNALQKYAQASGLIDEATAKAMAAVLGATQQLAQDKSPEAFSEKMQTINALMSGEWIPTTEELKDMYGKFRGEAGLAVLATADVGAASEDAKPKLDKVGEGLGAAAGEAAFLKREAGLAADAVNRIPAEKEVVIKVRTEYEEVQERRERERPGGGFQHGGRFVVKGPPGMDNVLVAFRATAGETVTVAPRGREAAGAGGVGRQTVINYGDTIINDRLAAAMWLEQQRRERVRRVEERM